MANVESREFIPDNFSAGPYPVVSEVFAVKSGEIIEKHAPVKLINGEAANVIFDTDAVKTCTGLYGIAAEASSNGYVDVVLTGEYHGNALQLKDSVTVAMLKSEFRKLSIFLK